jgi:hypothetical protein
MMMEQKIGFHLIDGPSANRNIGGEEGCKNVDWLIHDLRWAWEKTSLLLALQLVVFRSSCSAIVFWRKARLDIEF